MLVSVYIGFYYGYTSHINHTLYTHFFWGGVYVSVSAVLVHRPFGIITVRVVTLLVAASVSSFCLLSTS